ncbi:MAG: pantetheine-phosphate adenylyltransferase [Clostridia bacterium]|nr:pantetheine-phosphate adenylyltransferase [Clostridia bacterium]MBR2927113.1 pantetheine-phosphate adenylyltransferase [Clostridia bacterium]
MMHLVIVPGSFDPMTLGHRELVLAAASRAERVVVAVMNNAAKEYLFSMEERMEIAKRTLKDLPSVSVIGDSGMLIDLFDRLQADAVIKSYRNEEDLRYEEDMAEWNRAHNPRFFTVLIKATGELSSLSSTQVRDAMATGKDFSAWVHPDAYELIAATFSENGRCEK